MSEYICVTCDRVFEDGPPVDAFQLSGGKGSSRTITYKLADGSIHSLKKIGSGKKPPKQPEQN